MAKPTVSLPQGTRDFGPDTVRKRQYIFSTIRSVFELYGFQPLETPAMENLETLMGKYGEEGDKLIFKILNNGVDNKNKEQLFRDGFEKILQGKNTKDITERALRYDLTIPFARYVAMNQGQLSFPFKRYQIQPVWRADKPQRGRYREFYQCDADVVGSTSLLNEVELTILYAETFKRLGVPVEIKLNNRKILAALAEVCGGVEKMIDITVAIDKLDKIGIEKVEGELEQRGLDADQIATIRKYLQVTGSNEERIGQIKALLGSTTSGAAGISELEFILGYFDQLDRPPVAVDFTLARGLNYYTGTIFEVKALGANMGSIGGGGRYDDLTGLFGVPGIPGVGISFGVDRIYDVMDELNLFPPDVQVGSQALFFNLGDAEGRKAFSLLQHLRNAGVRAELFHENTKFDKQFKYAEKKNIPFVIIIGSKELAENNCVIKDLRTGEQKSVSLDELVNFSFL
ncbi:histidine--tRNA ligase [Terrimonas sp. NA20]|uniref:Histidine--tRNA ligase n=1 Tax=Terrimonas ginsenosidimutans TaxID=2908004 RepID=A0ABS9KVQ1_9BACT|nr:histidine--tRNA ligase [Terrimonas ginsenosidimutans]MCG2616363.1 histidine--tRNA ligase [Terrimonas ginsenosidimutans]